MNQPLAQKGPGVQCNRMKPYPDISMLHCLYYTVLVIVMQNYQICKKPSKEESVHLSNKVVCQDILETQMQ